MSEHVCPWWLGYALDNPLRRLLHDPRKMLSGQVDEGDTAIDLGCGMGHFTLGMARLVGDSGQVIAVDLQPKMLSRVTQRAAKAGLASRVRVHQCAPTTIGLREPVDFALAFWMVHETPDTRAFLEEVRALLKPNARLMMVEPRGHVSAEHFAETVAVAHDVGLRSIDRPKVAISHAALLALQDKE